MSATSDLENYIKNFRLTTYSASSSSGSSFYSDSSVSTISSVDTDELLSNASSLSDDSRPMKNHKSKGTKHKKRLKTLKPAAQPAYLRPLRKTPLKMINEEEDDENHRPSYNIQDYLPSSRPTSKAELLYSLPPKPKFLESGYTKTSNFHDQSRALKQFIDGISIDDDASSACSSVDTEALLQSSDDDEPVPKTVAKKTVTKSVSNQFPSVEFKKSHSKSPMKSSFSGQFPSMDHQTFIKARLPPRCEYLEGTFKPKDLKSRKASSSSRFSSESSEPPSSERKEYIFTDRSDYIDFGDQKLKDSLTNPMISVASDNLLKSSRPASACRHHERQFTGDFAGPPKSTSPEPGVLRMFQQHNLIKLKSPNRSDEDSKVRILSTEQTTRSEQPLDSPLKQLFKSQLSVVRTIDVCISSNSKATDAFARLLLDSDRSSRIDSMRSKEEAKGPRMRLNICTCILRGTLVPHLEDCQPVTVTAVVDKGSINSSVGFRSPSLNTPSFSPRAPSFLKAVTIIQRGVRSWLTKRHTKRRVAKRQHVSNKGISSSLAAHNKPIEASLSVNGESNLTSLQYSQSFITGSAEIDRATQSLYRALDQLRALKQSSQEQSQESSFSLTESRISLDNSLSPTLTSPFISPLLHSDMKKLTSPIRYSETVSSIDDLEVDDDWSEASDASSVDTDALLASMNSSTV